MGLERPSLFFRFFCLREEKEKVEKIDGGRASTWSPVATFTEEGKGYMPYSK